MFELLPIVVPATLVLCAAAVLVRRERQDANGPADETLEVPTVSIGEAHRTRTTPVRPVAVTGELVEPGGHSLGGRLRDSEPDRSHPSSGRSVRVRRRPLVADR